MRLAALGCMLLCIAFGGCSVRGSLHIEIILVFAVVAGAVGALMVLWSVLRFAKPARVACVSSTGLSLRSRDFDSGWLSRWEWREMRHDQIEYIEIGPRTDYPSRFSYSDTASYEFLVVGFRNGDGRVTRYAYAPLQRILHRAKLVAVLCNEPALQSKVVELRRC